MDTVPLTCDVAGEILAGDSMLNSTRGVLMITGSTFVASAEATLLILRGTRLDGRPNHHVLDVFRATEGYHRGLRYGFFAALR